ncbi:MAG: hypothetical protein LC799_06450 [Actinobacteria bacterium]|nr:hypothetical protein [Actinomycetota bacterium]
MNPPRAGAPGCDTHGHIPDGVHTVVELLVDRLQPWLERMARDGDPAQSLAASNVPCTWCPICALITALRGDRPEAVARLAQHGAGLIAAARELLTPPAEPAPSRGEPTVRGEFTPAPASTRSVQHIVVRSAAPGPGGTAGC